MNRTIGAAVFRAPPISRSAGSKSSRSKVFLWLLILHAGLAQAQSLTDAETVRRAAAIESARAGSYDDALRTLAELRVSHPDALDLLYDEITVLGWAERDPAVRARAAELRVDSVPGFVRLAVAKSLRNLRDFDAAVTWYSAALDADPGNADARLGLAYSLADAGDTARASAALVPLAGNDDRWIDATLASAYVDERAGHLLAALTAYDRVLLRAPDHANALRGKALVLRQLLLPDEALVLARAHPGILTDAEIARLEADQIALQVRYGVQVAYPTADRYAMTDRAIAALDAYLADGVGDEPTEHSLRSDRVIALAERRASAQAVEEFESLERDGVVLSAPVLAAAGQAYLDLRAPESALPLLQRATDLEPSNFDFNVALFFAYTESNRHDDALELARRLAASMPLVSGIAGSPTQQPNPDRLRAEVLVALALAYADRLAEAQALLERWLSEAPNNADLRHELANVYRWRGWLDRSLYEYRQVLAVEPDLLQARVGKAHTELERHEYEAADRDVAALNASFPDESAVAQLTTRWAAHDSSELRVDASAHDSSGVTFGSRQYDVALTWLSAPIDYRYRAFVRSRDSFAEFPEGDSRRRRLAAGAQYDFGRWFASGEISVDRDGGGELGARLDGAYRRDDFWLLTATLELESDAVPLRGHRVGLDSDLLTLGARYAPDETWTLGAAVTLEDYSDGNAHSQLAAQGRRRLINQPAFVVEVLGEAFLGQRQHDDVPYFSPLRDAAAIVGVEGQWRAVRRYERRLTHILRGEVGTYDQSGFSRGTIWRLAYMLPIELSPKISTWLGVWRNRMFYDGAQEYSTTGAFSLQVRF